MRLLLLRHGQTVANTTAALDTAAPGHDLTELGVRQAQRGRPGARLGRHRPGRGVHRRSAPRRRRARSPRPSAWSRSSTTACARSRPATSRCAATRRPSRASSAPSAPGWRATCGRRMPGGETGVGVPGPVRRRGRAGLRPRGRRRRSSSATAPRSAPGSRTAPRGDHAPIHEGLHNTGCITLDGEPGRRLDHRVLGPRADRRRVAGRRTGAGPDRRRAGRRGRPGAASVLRVVAEVGREPALGLGQGPALALGVVGDLVATEPADDEVLRLRVGEVPARTPRRPATSPSTR